MIIRKSWQFVATRQGTYTVTVEVEAPVGGMDPAELDVAWQAIRGVVDHADLDAELVATGHIAKATTAHVAAFLLREFAGELDYGGVQVESVTVADSPDVSVTARREAVAT
jgi:hypothetical protein